MIPRFGYFRDERKALATLFLTGLFGLLIFPTGFADNLVGEINGKPFTVWFSHNPGRTILHWQGLLVLLTGFGWLLGSFSLLAIAVLSGLVFLTPIGIFTFIPAIWVLRLMIPRRRCFFEFYPRWKGEGPPPPGYMK